jgi:hypothetical protein
MRYWCVAVAAVVAVLSVTSACGNQYPVAPSASQSAVLVPGSDAPLPLRGTAKNSEQLVFSGVATEGSGAPVGFWIWCEVDSGNGYNEECNGSTEGCLADARQYCRTVAAGSRNRSQS